MLKEKIIDRSATVGVIGLGYVGLPLAVEKAKAGFKVIGFDIQESKVKMVNEGHNYIGDVVNADLEKIVSDGHLRATADFDELGKCDVVAICVPTPLDIYKQPDLTYVINSTKDVAKRLHKDMLVVLESTTYPGTTEDVMKPILEETGLVCGKDFYLAFSPERVDPGNLRFKTKAADTGEHLQDSQHSPDKRDGNRGRQNGDQHMGCDKRCFDQTIRFHALLPRTGCRWSLHPYRSLLSHVHCEKIRLPHKTDRAFRRDKRLDAGIRGKQSDEGSQRTR